MAKLLTYDGQVIDPTAYIYIYIYISQTQEYYIHKNVWWIQAEARKRVLCKRVLWESAKRPSNAATQEEKGRKKAGPLWQKTGDLPILWKMCISLFALRNSKYPFLKYPFANLPDSSKLYCKTPEKWFRGEFSVKWFEFRPKSHKSRFLGRASDEALFSEKKGVFSEEGGGIQWMRRLVRISTGKAIQWRGPGHSVNRRTPKIEKLLSKSTSQKSAPKSELQVKSRSYSTKSQSYSWGDPQNPNRIAQKAAQIWSAANGGLRDGGLSKSEDIQGKRPFSSVFWISQVLFAPSRKGRKRPISADFREGRPDTP